MSAADLVDPEAGRVLVQVLCGQKLVGVVQEKWTTETPAGELMSAMSFRYFFGRRDGGQVIGAKPLHAGRQYQSIRAWCRQHGQVDVDATPLALAAAAAIAEQRPRVVRAVRHVEP